MIKDRVRIHIDLICVGGADKRPELGSIAKPGLEATTLVEVTEVVVIKGIVTHRISLWVEIGTLAYRREPDGCDASLMQLGQLGLNERPPVPILARSHRAIPVERLHQNTHVCLHVFELGPSDP